MAEYPHVTLREIAAANGLVGGPFGSSLVSKDYVDAGVPVIRGENLNHGKFIGGEFVYVSSEKFERDLKRNSARRGDVIYTQRGTLGQVALVDSESATTFVVSQSQMRLRVDPDRADPEFVFYASRSPGFLRQIGDNAIATGVPHVNLGILSRLSIPLPPVREQRAIAEVLGALDDKIAANTRLTTTADALAHALVGHATSTNSRVEQLAAIADFHNKRRVPLSSREREERQGGVPYYGANGAIGFVDEAIFNDEYVLVGEDGTVVTSAGLPVVNYIWGPAWVNNHAHVLSGRSVSTRLLRLLVSRTSVDSVITGAVQPKLSMGNLGGIAVTFPSEDVLPALEAQVGNLMGVYMHARDQNAALGALRDTLLPQFVSGKLRVREAAEMAGL